MVEGLGLMGGSGTFGFRKGFNFYLEFLKV